MTTTDQEQKRPAEERFHRCYERPVLETILRHNTDNLEKLVDQCSAKLRGELFPGEHVLLHRGSTSAKIKGIIVKLDGPPQSKGSVSEKTSAAAAVSAPADHKYTVTIEQQQDMLQVVGIPGTDLVRQSKLPSKDAIKTFIKAHAACNEVTREWRLLPGKAAEYGLKVGGHHADVNQLLQRQRLQPQIHLVPADAKPPVSIVKPAPAVLAPSSTVSTIVSELGAESAISSVNGTQEIEPQKSSERLPTNGSSAISSSSSGNSKPASAQKRKSLLPNGSSRSEGKKSSSKAMVTMDAFFAPKPKRVADTCVALAPEAVDECCTDTTSGPIQPVAATSADGRPGVCVGGKPADVARPCGSAEKRSDASDVSKPASAQTAVQTGAPGQSGAAPSIGSGTTAADDPSDAMSWDSDDSMVLSAVKKQMSPGKKDITVGAANPSSGNREPQALHNNSPKRPAKVKERKKKPKNIDGKSRVKTEAGQRRKADLSSSDDEVALIAYKTGINGASRVKPATGEAGTASRKGGLKQATLFDLSRKSANAGSSVLSASSPQQPVTPEVVHKYQKAEAELDFARMQQLLQQAAIELSAHQRESLPDSMKAAVREKHDYIELKKKMKFASAEDKATMQKQLRTYRLRQAADKRRMMQMRCEDSALELKPLPEARPLGSAEDAVAFAEAVRVSEFIRCYQGLLAPGNTEDDSKVTAEILLQLLKEASTGDPQAVAVLGKIVAMLLQTLVNDELLEGVKVLGVPVRDIPVNAFTASEMARLVLTNGDRAAANSGSSDEPDAEAKRRSDFGDLDGADGIPKNITDDLLSRLGACEFSALTPDQNLAILTALCDRVLCSRSAENYVADKQQEAIESCKQRIAEAKVLNQKKSELEKQGNQTDGDTTKRSSKGVDVAKLDAANEVAAAEGAVSSSGEPATAADSDVSDRGAGLAAVLRQRREQAAKSARERELKQQQERIQREREAEIRRLVKQLETLEKLCTDRTTVAKEVLRCTPLGFDRNHNRYWFFASARPGVYVEQGWVGEEMAYCVQTDLATSTAATCGASETERAAAALPDTEPVSAADREAAKKATSAVKQRSALSGPSLHAAHFADAELEKTHPMPDRNQWFVYDNQKDVDALLAALHPRGIRETALADNIRQLYPELMRLMKAAVGAAAPLTATAASTGEAAGAVPASGAAAERSAQAQDIRVEELANAVSKFREELEYQESRLRSGSLGGVSDVDAWLRAVHASSDISALAARLIECGEAVFPKFIKGSMGPSPHGTESSPTVTQSNACSDAKTVPGSVIEKQLLAEDPSRDTADNTFYLDRWKEAVRSAATVSRLHVLLGILEACIRWDKSAENAKCKVCRRKGDETSLLLCDECNMAFHTQCLRPALSEVPDGDWFCPACKPILPKRDANVERRTRPVSSLDSRDGSLHSDDEYDDKDRESDGSEVSGNSSDESKEDVGVCCVCSDGSGCLVVCSVCSAAYHLRCHTPPLRCPPVGTNWACVECRASRDTVNKKRAKQSLKHLSAGDRSRQGRREGHADTSDDDSESEYESEEQDSNDSDGDARGSGGTRITRSESRSATRASSTKTASKKGSRVPDEARAKAAGSSLSRRSAKSVGAVGSAKRPVPARETKRLQTPTRTSGDARPLGTVISTTLVDEGGSVSDEDSSSNAGRERRSVTVVRANLPANRKRGKRVAMEEDDNDEEDEGEMREVDRTDGEESDDDELEEADDDRGRANRLTSNRRELKAEGTTRGVKVSGATKNGPDVDPAAFGRARKGGNHVSKGLATRGIEVADSGDDSSPRRGRVRETKTARHAPSRKAIVSSDDSDSSPRRKLLRSSRAIEDSDADVSSRSSSRRQRQAASRQSKQAAVVAIRNGYDSLSESDSVSPALDRGDEGSRKHLKQGQAKDRRSSVGDEDAPDEWDMPCLERQCSEGSGSAVAKRKKSSDDVQGSKRHAASRDSAESSLRKSLDAVLQKLLKHPSSADFEEAVDPTEVPDYYDVIEKPITLISINDKISKSQYDSADDFLNDMTLLFRNAFEYNKVDSEVGRDAKRLEDEFIRLLSANLPSCRYQSQYQLFAASAAAAGKASKQRR